MSQIPGDESVGALIARLVADAKDYGRAEASFYRVLARERLGEARSGLVAGVAAFVLAFAAVVALLVGLVLTLATLIGPGLATMAVVIVALAIAALLGRHAVQRLRHAVRPTDRELQ